MDSFIDDQQEPDHKLISHLMENHFQMTMLRVVEEIMYKKEYKDDVVQAHFERERQMRGDDYVDDEEEDDDDGD
jgi:hypothetical protein